MNHEPSTAGAQRWLAALRDEYPPIPPSRKALKKARKLRVKIGRLQRKIAKLESPSYRRWMSVHPEDYVPVKVVAVGASSV